MSADLPTVAVVDEALGALAEIYDALPKDLRPKHAGDYRDVRTLLERIKKLLGSGGLEAMAKKTETSEGESTPPASVSAAVERLLALIDKLSESERRELFDVARETWAACGHKYASEREIDEHADRCPICSEEDEDEEDES